MSARETQSGGASRRSNLTRPMKNASATLKQIDPAEERELQRGLTNRHLQLIALGGAIGTGMFMGSSSTIHLAGPSSALIYALIGFFMYFMMRAFGEMLLSNLHYKSFRDIAEDLLGPAGGFIAGWTYWFSWIVAAMGDLAAITAYAQYWWPNIPKWLPATALATVPSLPCSSSARPSSGSRSSNSSLSVRWWSSPLCSWPPASCPRTGTQPRLRTSGTTVASSPTE